MANQNIGEFDNAVNPFEQEPSGRNEFSDAVNPFDLSYQPSRAAAPQTETEQAPSYNWLRMVGDRATDMVGNLIGLADQVGDLEREYSPIGRFAPGDDGKLKWMGADEYREYLGQFEESDFAERTQEKLDKQDFGYKPTHTWETAKEAYDKGLLPGLTATGEYIIEQGPSSLVDMAAAYFSLPAYVGARAYEGGKDRAINSGREESTIEDTLTYAPFAVGESILERVLPKGVVKRLGEKGSQLVQEVGENAMGFALRRGKEAAKDAGRGLVEEAFTEGVQSGLLEYVGTRFGTDAEMSFTEALDQGLAGAVVGGPVGGATSGSAGLANQFLLSPQESAAVDRIAGEGGSIDIDQTIDQADADAQELMTGLGIPGLDNAGVTDDQVADQIRMLEEVIARDQAEKQQIFEEAEQRRLRTEQQNIDWEQRQSVQPVTEEQVQTDSQTVDPDFYNRQQPANTAMGDALKKAAGETGPDIKERSDEYQVDRKSDTNELGFYSSLKRAAESIKQEKGTGQQILAQIKKQPGVKAEELEWTGLEEYISARESEGKKVTKQEVVDYLDNNGVKIEEVTLSGEGSEEYRERLERSYFESMVKEFSVEFDSDEGGYVIYDPNGEIRYDFGGTVRVFDSESEALDDLEREIENNASSLTDDDLAQYTGVDSQPSGSDGPAKYTEYQVPGGENYREILLTLPPSSLEKPDADGQVPYVERFDSAHFDEENILAHIRLNDRTDKNGNKVLFVEEVQSDWHQQAKKRGYKRGEFKPSTKDDVRVEFIPPDPPPGANPENYPGYYNYYDTEGNLITRGPGRQTEEQATQDAIGWLDAGRKEGLKSALPDAPFKNNAWAELAMKRVMRLASEGGYDAVAWTTGDQQADRYDLSSQVDTISAAKNRNGKYNILVEKNGNLIAEKTIDEVDIDSFVGKDLAKKIIDSEDVQSGNMTSFSGLDLKVGGEGMRGFYDKALPNIAKKVARKLDKGANITQADFGDFQAHAIPLTDKARSSALEGQSLFEKPDQQYKGESVSAKYRPDPEKTTQQDMEAHNNAGKELDRWYKKSRAKTLANRVTRDFEDKGETTLIGKKVENDLELAELAEIYRNPMLEAFRVFYVKNNHIVGQTGITSRWPNAVSIFANDGKLIKEINEQVKNLDADGYYIQHNHPSGNPKPSRADIQVTAIMASDAPGMYGHIVINGDEYSFIDPGKINVIPSSLSDIDDYYEIKQKRKNKTYDKDVNPLVENPLLNYPISGPDDLTRVADRLKDEDTVQIISRGSDGSVAGIASVETDNIVKALKKRSGKLRLLAELRMFQRQTGGSEVFAVNVTDIVSDFAKNMLLDGYLTDVIKTDGTSARTVGFNKGKERQLPGIKINENMKLMEDIPEYGHDPYQELKDSLSEKDQTIFTRIKKYAKKELTPGGNLPDSVFREKIIRDNAFNTAEFDIEHGIGGLRKAVRDVYKKSYAALDQGLKDKINNYLAGKNEDLPVKIKEAVLSMRADIAGLSNEYMLVLRDQILDMVGPDVTAENFAERASEQAKAKAVLLNTIYSNRDSYVTRSYKAFDDPDWPKKVSEEVIDNAATYLEQQYANGGEVTPEIKEKVADKIELILKEGTAYDSLESFITETKLGSKDLSSLMKRKDIAPEIRALLGEHKDVELNYARTITKMSRLIGNQRFLDKVLEYGMGEFLFTPENRPRGATKMIAAEGSKVMEPLNGLYTYPEVEQAFKDALNRENVEGWLGAVIRFNGLVKFGKAQPLDSVVYTPNGPAYMGDIQVGDYVCGAAGKTRVVGVYPQGLMDVYRITFADGSEVESTSEHLWEVSHYEKRYTGVFQLSDIMQWPEKALRNTTIPVGSAFFSERDVCLPPYLMGALIADGCSTGKRTMRYSKGDPDTVARVSDELPSGYSLKNPSSWAGCDYSIVADNFSEAYINGNKVMNAIKTYGLCGKRSFEKFIPDDYKYNSENVRRNLIHGLMDGDGYVNRVGQPVFTTSSKQLAEDFREVAESLGATVITGSRMPKGGKHIAYRLEIRTHNAPEWFWSPAKKNKASNRKKPVKRMFRKIEHVGKKECQCIMVDDDRHLYMTNRFALTHNTVLSPTTAMRNFWSASFFAIANGHFDVTQMQKSFAGFKEYFKPENGGATAYLRELKELGVVYDTPYAGEMMDLLKDSNLENTLFATGPFKSLKTAVNYAQKFYQYGDDFWKIMGFENEKAMLMKHFGMNEAEAKIEAAERIRNTYPTYSMVPSAVHKLRRFPLVGTFVSFPAEIIRTSYHILRYLKQDYKKNRMYTFRKGLGLALASGSAYAAQLITKAFVGVSDDEEEAIRELAPPWQKNSNFVYLGRDKEGRLRYLDVSFMDPYNYFKRPINAILRNEPFEDELKSALKDMWTPFFGEDIAMGALMSLYKNKNDYGGPIFDENAPPDKQVKAIADYLAKNLGPGAYSNFDRMKKAIEGYTTRSGRKYTVEDEILANLGFRVTTFEPDTGLYYASFDYADKKRSASKTLNDVLRDPNKVTDDEIKDAYASSKKTWDEAYTDMIRVIEAARKSGMTEARIEEMLDSSNIADKDWIVMLEGDIPDYRLSKQGLRNATTKAGALHGDKLRDEIERRYEYVYGLIDEDQRKADKE